MIGMGIGIEYTKIKVQKRRYLLNTSGRGINKTYLPEYLPL